LSKAVTYVLVLAFLVGKAAFVRADVVEQTFQFDCDVPPGKVSEWNGTVPPAMTQVSGRIQLIEARHDERWLPSASVRVVQAEEKIGLRLYVTPDAPQVLQVELLRPGSKNQNDRGLLTTVPADTHSVAFTLSATAAGDIRVTIGGKDASLAATHFRAQKISLSCSTGEFKFVDVSVKSNVGK
jgi:hypothetical protein